MLPAGFGIPSAEGDRQDISRFSLGHGALQPIAALFDGFAIIVAGGVATLIYQRLVASGERYLNVDFLGVALVTAFLFVMLSHLAGGYDPKTRANSRASIVSALKLWGLTLAFMALCGFLFKVSADFSRVTMLLYAASGAVAISAIRALWPRLVRHAMANNMVFVTNVLVVRIVGDRDLRAGDDGARLHELRENGLRPVGWRVVSIDPQDARIESVIALVDDQFRLGKLNEIVLLADHETLPHLDAIVERLRVVPVPVRFILDAVTRNVIGRPLKKTGSLVLAEYQRAPFSLAERFLKRGLDIVVSLVGMILLSPIFMLVALAVKLDSPGPVLFRQSRRGFGGKTFLILKFRSMTVADNGAVVIQAKRDDARITRVGRWLRRLSIDELPQLWNVLEGEMSIVGPRPHAIAHDDYYSRLIEQYAFRHHAKPGITGWAQVKGLRGETPLVENMKARVEKDIWYIDNWSIWLDFMIIFRTATVLFGHKMAY